MALVEKPLRRIEIANKLDVKSGAIGASLKTLQNKILIELNNGKYQIYDFIFKAWLKKEKGIIHINFNNFAKKIFFYNL